MGKFEHILALDELLGLKTPNLEAFDTNILLKCLSSNRNSPDVFAVTFYERHLWAGLLGWPD